jgi:hypothetical protein
LVAPALRRSGDQNDLRIKRPEKRQDVGRYDTYLATALLAQQNDVAGVIDASLQDDPDSSGRDLVTRALKAAAQDPLVRALLDRLEAKVDEAYTETGKHSRKADSPLVKIRSQISERERAVRELMDRVRQTEDIDRAVKQDLPDPAPSS